MSFLVTGPSSTQEPEKEASPLNKPTTILLFSSAFFGLVYLTEPVSLADSYGTHDGRQENFTDSLLSWQAILTSDHRSLVELARPELFTTAYTIYPIHYCLYYLSRREHPNS